MHEIPLRKMPVSTRDSRQNQNAPIVDEPQSQTASSAAQSPPNDANIQANQVLFLYLILISIFLPLKR